MPTEKDLMARLAERNARIAELEAENENLKAQLGPVEAKGREEIITKPFPPKTKGYIPLPSTKDLDSDDL